MGRLRTEVRGRGWSLSVQRWSAVPTPPHSSNLGTAALCPIGRRAGIRRVAVRLAEGERLWIAIAARRGVTVSATLAGGRALADDILSDRGEEMVHRLARIAGEPAEGIGREHVPLFREPQAAGYSVAVAIGPASRLHLCLFDSADFDPHFGAPPVGPEPAVYGGWRLP